MADLTSVDDARFGVSLLNDYLGMIGCSIHIDMGLELMCIKLYTLVILSLTSSVVVASFMNVIF